MKQPSDKTVGEYYAAMGADTVTVDELAARMGLPPDRVQRGLRILESLGGVKVDTTGRYRRVAQEEAA